MSMKFKFLLSAVILLGLTSPGVAEEIPCLGLGAPQTAKDFENVWNRNATPEHPAPQIFDVIPPLEDAGLNVCVLHMVTTEGDNAYFFDAEIINGRMYLNVHPSYNTSWDSWLVSKKMRKDIQAGIDANERRRNRKQ